jgi:hypothetical protein
LDIAEHAARDLTLEVLEDTEFLADWQIVSCQVGFDERFVEAGLDAADGLDAPPADVAAAAGVAHRTRRHRTRRRRGRGCRLARLDPRPRDLPPAFDSDVFDTAADSELARLAAGALVLAAGTIVDELFQDLEILTDDDRSGAGTVVGSGPYFVLDNLPRQFANTYDLRFTRRFLVAAVTVTVTGLVHPGLRR